MSNPRRPKLCLLILEASKLLKKDIFGLSDPYVKVFVRYANGRQRQVGTTHVIKKTLHPKWDEIMEFNVPREEPFSVILDTYDENILIKDDFLGRTMLHFEISSMRQGLSSTHYSTLEDIAQHGLVVFRNLHNKYNPENLSGYRRFPHVDEMARDYVARKYDKSSDMGKSWGTIKLGYLIYDERAPPTTPDTRPTTNSPLPYPTTFFPGANSSNPLPYPTSDLPGTSHEQPHSSQEHGDEDSESDSELDLPSGWDRRVDSNGRHLYVNHHRHQASLRHPTRQAHRQAQGRSASTTPQLVSNLGPLDESTAVTPLENRTPDQPAPSNLRPAHPHPRQFLNRSHSLDIMEEIPGVAEDTESGSDESPPHADVGSVLQPLAAITLDTQTTPSSQTTTPSPAPTQQQHNPGPSASTGGGISSLSHGNPGPSTSAGPSSASSWGSSSPAAATPQLSTALQRAKQGLSPNWEVTMTPSGRIYYIDHSNQTTTWEKPRYKEVKPTVTAAPATPVEQEADLPEGWEARKDDNGRTYYVDHSTRRTTWEHPAKTIATTDNDELGPIPTGWEMKQMKDGRIFFVDHITHSTQWEDPRLLAANKPTAKIQYSRDYKQKYTNFRHKLVPQHDIPRQLDIPCRRDHIFEDSYNVIMNIRDTEKLKSRLYVIFDGESGLDYGGLAREWFYLLSHEMFNPYYGLFEYSASDDYTLQINPDSELCNDNHLDYFRFIGRICGMAVYHNRLVDAFFIRPFYKMMLKKAITLDDMQSVDVEIWNSITYILENDPEPLCLDFSVNKTIFGEVVQVDLKPNGRNIPVTQKNKKAYIDLMMKWRFSDRVYKQMDAFLEGFSALVPLRLIKIFDEREIEYLLGGLAQIDVEDWKANTEYSGFSPTDQIITWFWKAVENYDGEMRARLLQFVTGTSKVPMNGFSELQGSQGPRKFCIKKFGEPMSLPRAHTCFNRIDLPPYASYHRLKEKLRIAVENTEGFEGID